MRNAFFGFGIVDVDWHGDYLDAVPRGKDEEFEFCFVARGEERESAELFQRIKTEACLGVFEVVSCLNGKPKVGKGIGELAAFASLHLLKPFPFSHDEGSWVFLVGLKHCGNILGKVLTVGIQSDGVGEPHLEGFLEASFQGIAFACILGIGNDGDSLDVLEDFECSVSTSISDNYYIQAMGKGTISFALTFLRAFVLEILFSALFAFAFSMADIGIYTGMVVGMSIGCIFNYIFINYYLNRHKDYFLDA
jgi:hypothetical protein